MKAFAVLLVLITLVLAFGCMSAMVRRSGPTWKNAVYLPNWLFVVGFLISLTIIIAGILLWRGNWNGVWPALLAALGWSMELAHANCWIIYEEKRFTHHTFFGRTHTFFYHEVTGIRYVLTGYSPDIKLYCGKHMIFLDQSAVNLNVFLRIVDRKCKNMRECPDRIRWDPYHHNIPKGKLLFFIFLASVLLWSAMLIFSIVSVFGPPESEATKQRREVVFTSWTEQKDGTLELTAGDEINYRIDGYISPIVEPEGFCDGKTVCTVWGYGEDIFWINQLRAGRRMIYTFEQCKEAYRRDQAWAVPMIGLFRAASLWAFIICWLFGRNPDRFSPRFREFFYRYFVGI